MGAAFDAEGLASGYSFKPELELTARQAKAMLEAGTLVLVDVRTPEEFDLVRVANSQLLTLSEIERRMDEIEPAPGQQIATLCHHGVRSLKAALALRASGRPELAGVKSVAGGIDAWSLAADPRIPRYERGPGVLRTL